MNRPLDRLRGIMQRLRDPETGCAWDAAQTFETIAPYTIEEAYEVVDAIERADMSELRSELGDLLLQVVFHAQIAQERGAFDFDDVTTAIADKMQARHPHIFGEEGGAMDSGRWEELKAREREASGAMSAMDGVALALPALMRAQKLQKRAARDGFDWSDNEGPKAKILEEIAELQAADEGTLEEEAGDVLFATVNFVRSFGVDPERALKTANKKFERRYRAMESMASHAFSLLSIEEQEKLWQRVKDEEKSE